MKKIDKSLSMNTFRKLGVMVLMKMIASVIDKTYPSDPYKREYHWVRIPKTIASFGLKKHSEESSVLLVHIIAESILIWLNHRYFVAFCIINAKGINWTKQNQTVKGIEQFYLYYFVVYEMI